MIWIDIVVTLLLTIRMALPGPKLIPLLNSEKDSSLPTGKGEEEEYLWSG